MLNKHELPVNREEAERVDTLRYSWEKLQVQASEVSTYLVSVQPDFKSTLVQDVKTFAVDCTTFYGDYKLVSEGCNLCCKMFAIEVNFCCGFHRVGSAREH